MLGGMLCAAPAGGEGEQPASRARVGLVLSGGGARGAAHIGVLEVLEELRVPVDLITGTSMGSVVGGLYAAGLSPEELSAAIQDTNWVAVFDDKPNRRDLSFRRKQDDRSYLTNLRVGFRNWRFFVPTGLVEGQKLDYLLRTLTLGPGGLARIESLRLPFRAVATDILTGEAVVFTEGELAVAQRASMSIPAAFSPVIVDGRMLVDGYVANNLPIDVAQELGADTVIAVDISTPLATKEEIDSAVAISGQASTFPTQHQQALQIERMSETDVLLRPALGDISSASFTRMKEAVEAGRAAAQAAAPQLSRYALSEEDYAAWRETQRRPPFEMPVIAEVRIENESLLADSVVRSRIDTRAGEPLDLDRLSDDLAQLFGTDAFERVTFDLHREDHGVVLVYRVAKRERGTNYYRVGINLESDFDDDAVFNIGLRHVWYPLNAWGGEMRNEGQFGDTMLLSSEFYQPLDPNDWLFFQPSVRFVRSDLDLFVRHDRVARYTTERTVSGAHLGVNILRDAQIRGGIGYLDVDARRDIGDPATFQSQSVHGGIYEAVFEYDDVDDPSFPNRGAYAFVSSEFVREELGFDESFEEVTGRASIFHTWGRNTLGLGARYATAIGGRGLVDRLNTLGGFLNLSGYDRDSIAGRHAGVAQLVGYRRIASPALFAWEFPVYVGGAFEAGNAWDHRSDIEDDVLLSGTGFFGVETPLGPLYLAYAYGEGGFHQGYLYLGQTF